MAASPGPLTTQPIIDKVIGVLICESFSSKILTVSITSNPCLAQDGQEIIFTPRCFKFSDFNISFPTCTSFTGSSDNETLIVSPIPSKSKVPNPIDDFIVPVENDKYFTEKLIKLKGCYQVTDNKRPLPKPKAKKEFGLPEDKFIFCSFNNTYKIQPEMFKVWMEILNTKKDSVLWLLEQDDKIKSNLLDAAKIQGIEKERIIFSKKISNHDHIQRQMCADLFLDTFPICAHTTASDALWVGLPLITMAGKSMVSRVAGSALKNIGMEELITYNLEDYKSKALYLSNNKDYLNKLKNKIIENRFSSKLFNTKEFTKNLEDEYKKLFLNFKNKI